MGLLLVQRKTLVILVWYLGRIVYATTGVGVDGLVNKVPVSQI